MGSLGVSHNIERITDDGLFSADILIEDDKVIVEVDGPHHFTVNTHQPLGESLCLRLAYAALPQCNFALCFQGQCVLSVNLVTLMQIRLLVIALSMYSGHLQEMTFVLYSRCYTVPS